MDDYLPLGEAARRLGISEFTMRRRIAAGEIPVWTDPLDRRRDLDRYKKPRPREAPMPAA